MKKNFSNIILIAVFFVGLAVLLYPTVSNYWNSKVQSRAIVNYESILAEMQPEDYTEMFEAADRYNQELYQLDYPLVQYDEKEGYEELLNIDGDGLIGYVTIDEIEVKLPIYHGTSDLVLSKAAGHLEGTSLPVGGLNTHSVISAHRGLPSAELFTNLDEMKVGDFFTITVLDRILTYEVDQISIVKPNDVHYLAIEENEDYCTLLTCTPYGINTERLLVRGTRVETVAKKQIHIATQAYQLDSLLIAPVVAAPMLLILLIIVLVKYRKK